MFGAAGPLRRSKTQRLQVGMSATVTCAGNGRLYTAEITYGASGRMTVEWDPCTPIKNGKGQLTRIGLKRYQQCRNQLAQQVADYIGGAVLMVD
jgi:hypothetical protein